MKTRNLLLIALSTVLLLGAIAILNNTEKPVMTSAGEFPRNQPTLTPHPTAIAGVSAQILEKFANSGIMTQMMNGVEMSAANFRIEQNELNFNEFKVDICFQLPNSETWLIVDARLRTGGTEIPSTGAGLIEELRTLPNGQKRVYSASSSTYLTDPADTLPEYRCETVRFRLEKEVDLSNFTLEILTIHMSLPEGTGCETFFDNVQSILDAEGTGIRLDCVKQDYGEFMSIAEKPETMSEEEAQRLINNARYKLTTIDGPWIFTGSIE